MSRPNLSPWLERALDAAMPEPQLSEVGRVASLADGVAMVSGLDRALADERLMFESGIAGVVQDLEPDRLGVMLLGATDHVRLGEAVYRTHSVVSVPVGSALLGRIVNAVGQPLDGKGAISTPLFHPVERDAPGILERAPVQRPLATGLKVIDAAIPVGLGQRQLIIGDRQTGKTSLALDTMLNQRETGVLCIYCAIGQRGDAVARVAHDLQQGDMLARTVVLHAGDEEVPGLAYMAPYAAMTMAEYFCSQGHDVLVVLDDMIRHAHAYRELSLLLRRPPGREAFPGDIFYIHARLLERGGQFTDARKHGSITVLPVVETQAENLSAYIPTNLISITDGQVYLSPRQVQKNQFPAAELGLSVSRVGGKAQHPVLREIASNLRVTLSQFEEQEDFARFGTRLDADTRARLKRGSAVRRALRQGERDPMTITAQVAILVAAMEGVLDAVSDEHFVSALSAIRVQAEKHLVFIEQRIKDGQPLTVEDKQQIAEQAAVVVAALKHG